jgi:MFS family permease
LDKHDPYAPFRRPDFRRLLSSWMLSGFANRMQTVAVGWYVYERTGSALAIGWVGLAQFAPVLLLFLPAGHLVDRYERRSVLMGSLVVAALGSLLMFLAVAAHASLGWIYLGCFITGSAMAVNRPVRSSFMPKVVPLAMLPSAVAWAAGMYGAFTFFGPVLSGLIIAVSGDAVINFGANFVLYFVSLLMAARILARDNPDISRARGLSDILAGVQHVFRTPVILGSLVLDLASALFGGALALLPVYAKDILEVGPTGLGWMTAAPAVGSVCMALILGHMKPTQRGGIRFIVAMGGYGVATMIFGMSTSFALSMAALVIVGAMNNINHVTRQTLMQSYTPEHLRGRASSVNTLFASSSNELGAFECGAVAALAGPVFAVASGGAITVLAAAWVAWKFPDLRRLTSLAPGPYSARESSAHASQGAPPH